MRYPRLRMRLALIEQAHSASWRPRPIRAEDTEALGALMSAAYRGTVDDEGESEPDAITEVESTVAGEYGTFLSGCSFVVEDGAGRPIGASMITLHDEFGPILTYLVVHPDMQRRGIGAFLVKASSEALRSAGHARMDLFVTQANEPAVNLYRKLGFEVVDRITEPA